MAHPAGRRGPAKTAAAPPANAPPPPPAQPFRKHLVALVVTGFLYVGWLAYLAAVAVLWTAKKG